MRQHLALLQCFRVCYKPTQASLATAKCVVLLWHHVADKMHKLVQVQCHAAVSLIHLHNHDMLDQVMP